MPDATPHYQDDTVTLHHGDCINIMQTLPGSSIDAIVTDPPYGLGFMGKAWDALPPGREWADQCLRVLKPGGHVLAFGGTRTWHRLAVAVEDAGFEIRDSIAWLYGSGFPKSLDVSKAIDKAAGAAREVIGSRIKSGDIKGGALHSGAATAGVGVQTVVEYTAAATDAAKQWQGWGTALKPAFEPIVVGRKPLTGTVAANTLQHGVGALNIDANRIGRLEDDRTVYGRDTVLPHANATASLGKFTKVTPYTPDEAGRWPANVTLDETQAATLDESRYFYVAKAPKRERPVVNGIAHPTVKPLTLMRWLVRLVTPPGGTVLEPFAGSGTTIQACQLEGFRCIAIERDADYLPLIESRLLPPWEVAS